MSTRAGQQQTTQTDPVPPSCVLAFALSVNQAALCCFADGQHRPSSSARDRGAQQDEREIKRWLLSLGAARVARRGATMTRGTRPCEVCGRCYPHEHVTAVHGLRSDSDEDTEASRTRGNKIKA